MNHMITVLSLDQPTVITHIGYRPLGLFAGCRTQIGSVLVNIFLCTLDNIYPSATTYDI